MTTIVTRTGKGSPLTHNEVDTNFTNLNTAKLEAGAIALGSAGTPSISFVSDTNTGIFSPGADQVAISNNGVARLTVNTAATTSTLPVVHPLGAVGTPSITFTGDLNTGVLSPGADQVTISTGGTGRLFVDASGNVGVGITPAANAGITELAVGTAASNPHFSGIRDGVNAFLLKSDSVTTALFERRNFDLVFGTNNSEKARIDSSGRLLVGTSSANANGGILQLTSGITFPATQVAATDANTLDDYEEGTWTPVLVATGATFTNLATHGRYVKIGTTVTLYGYIQQNCSAGAGANAVTITGMPFTSLTGIVISGASAVVANFVANTNGFGTYFRALANTVVIDYLKNTNDTGITKIETVMSTDIQSANHSIQFTFSYITS